MIERHADAIPDRKLDEVFDVLAHRHRREAVRVLQLHEGGVTRDELAQEIVARGEPTSQYAEAYRRVAIELHHNHLPMMAAAGLVNVDDGTVAIPPNDDEVAELVATVLALLDRPAE